MAEKRRLNEVDHQALICLIQGMSITQTAARIGSTTVALRARLSRIKRCLECETLFQVIATEVIYLMDSEHPVELKQRSMEAAA